MAGDWARFSVCREDKQDVRTPGKPRWGCDVGQGRAKACGWLPRHGFWERKNGPIGPEKAPGGTRTRDLLLRRQTLYPLSYGGTGGEGGIRTLGGGFTPRNRLAGGPVRPLRHLPTDRPYCTNRPYAFQWLACFNQALFLTQGMEDSAYPLEKLKISCIREENTIVHGPSVRISRAFTPQSTTHQQRSPQVETGPL